MPSPVPQQLPVKAPAGHCYMLAVVHQPHGWSGRPVLVLQPQYGRFEELGVADNARKYVPGGVKYVVLVEQPHAVEVQG